MMAPRGIPADRYGQVFHSLDHPFQVMPFGGAAEGQTHVCCGPGSLWADGDVAGPGYFQSLAQGDRHRVCVRPRGGAAGEGDHVGPERFESSSLDWADCGPAAGAVRGDPFHGGAGLPEPPAQDIPGLFTLDHDDPFSGGTAPPVPEGFEELRAQYGLPLPFDPRAARVPASPRRLGAAGVKR